MPANARALTLAPWALLVAALLLPVGVALRGIWAAGGAGRGVTTSAESLEDYGAVPDFALVDQGGRRVTRADLAGAPWLADFVFTHCAGSCPTLSAEMARLAGRMGEHVRLVSFSVDPERDTPEVLADYARKLGANPDRWRFLTGDAGALRRLVAEGFHLAAAAEAGAGSQVDITHSDRIALVDPELRIRRYYQGGDGGQWIEAAVRDLNALEAR